MTSLVAAAAIVQHGRVLAARRTEPAALAGGWELPGGKVEPGETSQEAAVREVREELGCCIHVERTLGGPQPLGFGYKLTVHLARLVTGEPELREHDLVRWLAPEELDDVAWLPGDLPILRPLYDVLSSGEHLTGGNVGGAVRVGPTVRRATGPWTPAVHALLAHLHDVGFSDVPVVLGIDARGREALTFLPGRVPDVDTEIVSEAALADGMRWLRRYHDAVEGVAFDGPWRTTDRELAPGELICHHDFAPYNVVLSASTTDEQIIGVFDWDMAGPGTRLDDLAFAAWNWVPLRGTLPASQAARRLCLMADAYASDVTAEDIAEAAVPRIERAGRVIAAGQAAGDPGMLNLAAIGEPERSALALAGLRQRMPAITAALTAAPSRRI
jgi:mutator protein MutT